MSEIETLKMLFEKFNESIRIYSDKVDEMLFLEYEDNYKHIFIRTLENIKEERNLNFDSIEAYKLFEKEIIKLIEIQKEKTSDFNKKAAFSAMEELNQNYYFEYASTEKIAKDMLEYCKEKANGYSVNNVNEIFMPKLFDLIYQQNISLNREDINEINRKLYLFIEESLNETKKIVSSKSQKTTEYLSVVANLQELSEYINMNKLSENKTVSNETESIFKYNSPEAESKFNVFKNAGAEFEKNNSVTNEQNPILYKYINKAKFGLTYELSNEVNISLINNEINLSDIDKIIETSGYKEISEEEFRKNAENALTQSRKLSVDNIFDSTPKIESKFKVFKNTDIELENNNSTANEQNLILQEFIQNARFGLNANYVNAIINSLQNNRISVSDIEKIIEALSAEFNNKIKKALLEQESNIFDESTKKESIFKH